jgi:hypothetical protein
MQARLHNVKSANFKNCCKGLDTLPLQHRSKLCQAPAAVAEWPVPSTHKSAYNCSCLTCLSIGILQRCLQPAITPTLTRRDLGQKAMMK